MSSVPNQSPINPAPGTVNAVVATVQVGTVTADRDDAAVFNDDGSDITVWADFEIKGEYSNDPHTYMLGVTSPNGFQGESVAFCTLSAPTLLWVCRWTACRFATQPNVPSPVPLSNRWVCMWQSPVTNSLGLAPDGTTPLYRISGTYIYGCKNPSPDVFDDVAFGRPPWMLDVFDRTMPSNKLQQGLADTLSSPGGNNVAFN